MAVSAKNEMRLVFLQIKVSWVSVFKLLCKNDIYLIYFWTAN